MQATVVAVIPLTEAWHEAGHALAAHLLGARVVLVTLESELDGHGGHVEVDWTDVAEHVRGSAMVALAGPVAELVYRGEELLDDPQVWAAWRADWDAAEACLEELESEPALREELRRALLAELQAAFGDPHMSERLARIADALDAHETLDSGLFADALG